MKPAYLPILLILIIQTQAFSQILTEAKANCDIFSDSTLSHKVYTLSRKDSVTVNDFYVMTGAYLVTHNTVEGYAHHKELKDKPELANVRREAYLSRKDEIMRSRPKNNIAVNLFGDNSTISASYERLAFIHPSFFIAGRLGIGYRLEEALPYGINSYLTLPFHVTANFGVRKHFFEIGIGWTTDLAASKSGDKATFSYVIVGYRFQPLISNLRVERKRSLRFNLLYGKGEAAWRMAPFGISIGKSF